MHIRQKQNRWRSLRSPLRPITEVARHVHVWSASLIGRLGASTFRLSTASVSMSLTGSRFSSDEAEQSIGRHYRHTNGKVQADKRTHLIHRPARTSFHRGVELEFPPIGFDPLQLSCCYRGLFPCPAELGAVNPDALHDHGQSAGQRHKRFFHPATPGDLHRPGLEPDHFLERIMA